MDVQQLMVNGGCSAAICPDSVGETGCGVVSLAVEHSGIQAAQKLTMSGRKKKRAQIPPDPEPPPFPTNFCDVIRMTPPSAPPQLLRNIGRLQALGSGKETNIIVVSERALADNE
ncbi:hypothetical protein LSH36_83g06059 [Paralvinella palmiformis]|uniref:Uncharacterized protein n=1 Tax=Paralvinella palmiformis TaxID=53620 RepID=A0AAD9K3A1_9ANNE|nr:hypothetical protein LSH36_83g06059 [Paralvinella palmiformis]